MQPGIHFVVVDLGGTGVKPADIVSFAAAFTKQLQQHLALPQPYGWGVTGTARAAAGPTDIHADESPIALMAHPDQAGALGDHDHTRTGRPFGRCFPLLDANDGVPWQQTAGHEGIETARDPEGNGIVQATWDGRIWADEPCDANEQGVVIIDGVPLSDFVLPPWYGSNVGRCNWLGTLNRGEVGPGGYAQWLDPQRGWQQVFHNQVAPRAYRQMTLGMIEGSLITGRGLRRQVHSNLLLHEMGARIYSELDEPPDPIADVT